MGYEGVVYIFDEEFFKMVKDGNCPIVLVGHDTHFMNNLCEIINVMVDHLDVVQNLGATRITNKLIFV
jgi:hypothetical protein